MISRETARVAAFKDVVRFGCRIVVKTPKIPVICTTWVRNFEDCGASPLSVVENICEYIAFKRAYNIVKGR
jgi:hypothetical protein